MDTLEFTLPSGRPVEIQEFTAEAERILNNKQEVKSGKWLNKFMAKALVSLDGKPVPKNEGERIALLLDMLTGDRNYLLLQLRMLNYGPDMTFNYKCPKCGKTSGYSMNLQQMLDDGTLKVHPYREDVAIIVETRSGTAEVTYTTGRTEDWFASLREPDRIHLAMGLCSSFNGHPPEYKEFAGLFAKDISEIRKVGNSLKGGLDPEIELDCLECDFSYEVMLYSISDFFTPLMMTGSTGR